MTDTLVNAVFVQAKSFLSSKTIWANLVMLLAGWLGAHNLPVDPDTQATLVGGIMAVVNIALRFATTTPINLSLPSKTPAPAPVAVPAAVKPSAGITSAVAMLLLAISVIGLSACATLSPPPSIASIVSKVQADYPVVKAVAAVYTASGQASPTTIALVAKIEAIADPEVAALSAISTPASVKAALADLSTVVAALPPGTIPAATQADITLLLAIANAGLAAAT